MKLNYLKLLSVIHLIVSLNILSAQESKLITFTDIPGRDPSDHYSCRIRQVGSAEWKNAFILQTTSKAKIENENYYVDKLEGWTASWISFEFSGSSVEVEISKKNGSPIEKAMVRPVGHASAAEIIDGKAYVRFDEPANVNVDIDGQMEDHYTGMGYTGPDVHTISIFANPVFHEPDTAHSNVYALEPGEAIPARSSWDTLYFKPGVHNIGVPFTMYSNETLYIPGNAVVHGTIYSEGSTGNITVYGSGTLSGEDIIRNVSGSEESKPINGKAHTARFEGIVIPDPAHHTVIFGNSSGDPQKINIFRNIKILGWRVNGDGIHLFQNGEIVNCFIRTQDDGSYYSGTVKNHDNVYWNDWNGCVTRIVKGGNTFGASNFKDNVVIYHRANWHYWNGGRIISFRDAGPGKTIKNVLVQNILVEDPLPAFPPFYFTMEETGDGTQVMENILIENVIQEHPGVMGSQDASRGKPQNTMLGLNSNNKFSNITFKRCFYNGKWLGSFEDGDFKYNQYVENITFIDHLKFQVSLSVNSSAWGSVSGGGTYKKDEEVTVTAFAEKGYKFLSWTSNGDTISKDQMYTFAVQEDAFLKANFSPIVNNIFVFATNCGGTGYMSDEGISFSSDVYFNGGSIYSETSPINETEDDFLYQYERFGSNFSYDIPIEKGDYEVTLMFAEIFWSSTGSREFNVSVEGSQVISKLDIYNLVGKNTPYNITFPVIVSDEELNIAFSAITDNAKISAIKIEVPVIIPSYEITTIATNGSILLTPSGGTYDSSQVVALTANPDPGFFFAGWSEDLSGTSNPELITMNGNKNVTATFKALPTYTLTADATNGTISLDPEGGNYYEGTTVTVTATPDVGYRFSGWGGDLTGTTNPVFVTMDSAIIITATFVEIPIYTLTTEAANGTISLDPSAGSYEENTIVTVTANPDDGFQFLGWSGNLSGNTNPAMVFMNANKHVKATFYLIPIYTLTTEAANGNISLDPSGGSYEENTMVTVTAFPDDGYQFLGWSGGLSGYANPETVTMKGDISITANFDQVIGVQEHSLPVHTILGQNHPNPFITGTSIPYQLSSASHVKLSIYNILGDHVATLVNDDMKPGYYMVDLNATDLMRIKASGTVYIYRLETDDHVYMKKFIHGK